MALPVLAYATSPAEAIFLSTGVDMVTSAYLTFAARKQVQWRLVAWMIGPAMVGQWIGTELLQVLPEETTTAVIAVVIGALGLDILLRPERPGLGTHEVLPTGSSVRFEGVTAGAAGGLVGGLVGTPGPPLAWFMRRWFTPMAMRAQMLGILTAMAVPLLAMGAAKGLFEASTALQVGLLAPPAFLAGVAGAKLAPKVPRVPFLRAVGLVLLGSATMLVVL